MPQETVRTPLPKLVLWRGWRNLSIRALAEKAHIGYPTISLLERGKMQANPTTVFKLARALGITRKQLLEEDPPEDWLNTREGEEVKKQDEEKVSPENGRAAAYK
jgi:transcriptional regulator with XRE-family HTH domain